MHTGGGKAHSKMLNYKIKKTSLLMHFFFSRDFFSPYFFTTTYCRFMLTCLFPESTRCLLLTLFRSCVLLLFAIYNNNNKKKKITFIEYPNDVFHSKFFMKQERYKKTSKKFNFFCRRKRRSFYHIEY